MSTLFDRSKTFEEISELSSEDIKEARKKSASDVVGASLDLSLAKVDHLLDREAPKREWIVENLLPCGIVGLIAAAGGVGKSFLLLMLAVSTCTGLPWLGIPIVRRGSVLMFSAEDDRDEIHRRLRAVVAYYRQLHLEQCGDIDRLVRKHLYIFDRVGADNRLTEKRTDGLARTQLLGAIVKTARQIDDLVLVTLDPLSRFDGGDANDNGDATRLIECAEHIRKETRASVLFPHHVAKFSSQNLESGQEAVRGASALVDGARWVGLLRTMQPLEAKKYGVAPREMNHYVRFSVPKANYGPPREVMWLKRELGGVLSPVSLDADKLAGRRRSADRYAEVLSLIIKYVKQAQDKGEALSIREFRARYAGVNNVLNVSDETLRDYLPRAVGEGSLRMMKRPGQRGEVLVVPPK